MCLMQSLPAAYSHYQLHAVNAYVCANTLIVNWRGIQATPMRRIRFHVCIDAVASEHSTP